MLQHTEPPHAPGDDAATRAEAGMDQALRELARRKSGARRTAWIIGAVALAFFIASLVHGHLVGISNWVPPH